jgi:alcohol dehydrogenase class IV
VFLLVSDTLDKKTDEVEKVRRALGKHYAASYGGIPPHTPREAVLDAAAAARKSGADLVATLGGGSVTDAAKMLRVCLEHDVTSIDGLNAFRTIVHEDGRRHIPDFRGPRIPQITIPTTLSGGEFNVTAGCTDERRKMKESYRHALLVPRVLILDPAVTVHTPEWLWLSTGVRAVDHATETLSSLHSNPYTDGCARQALRLLTRALPRCKANPKDIEARLDCLIGVWISMEHNQGGVSMGCSHGIGHVLGGTCGVPHGHTSCVLLPNVLRYNKPANAHRQELVSEAFGCPGEDAAQVVGDFISALGMPRTLRDVGIAREQFPLIAKNAMHDRYMATNPRPIKGPQDVMEILELAA